MKNIVLCVVSLYVHGDWMDINIYAFIDEPYVFKGSLKNRIWNAMLTLSLMPFIQAIFMKFLLCARPLLDNLYTALNKTDRAYLVYILARTGRKVYSMSEDKHSGNESYGNE